MNADDAMCAVTAAIERHRGQPGALLPLLHAVQDTLGYIPPQAVAPIAQAMNLSHAEVHGVLTFYHQFRQSRPGRKVLRICQAEACQSMGAAALTVHAQQRLGCGLHETTADGSLTIEPVYCLGLCALSPAASIGEQVHARLTPEKLDRLLAASRHEDDRVQETP
jgi:formate dehydrogenase subunit gamma